VPVSTKRHTHWGFPSITVPLLPVFTLLTPLASELKLSAIFSSDFGADDLADSRLVEVLLRRACLLLRRSLPARSSPFFAIRCCCVVVDLPEFLVLSLDS